MYIKEIDVENLGPLEKANIKFSFNEDGSPKPLILVGKNGSGKSTLISNIVDSFYELASKSFDNVRISQNGANSYAYYKIISPSEISIGKEYLYSRIKFRSTVCAKIEYLFAKGKFSNEKLFEIGAKETDKKDSEGNVSFKRVDINCDNESNFVKKVLGENVIAYFSPERYEKPSWMHKAYYGKFVPEIDSEIEVARFRVSEIFSNELRNPISVNCGEDDLLQWLLDVIVDSRAEVDFSSYNEPQHSYNADNLNDAMTLSVARENVQKILSSILNEDVRFNLQPRLFVNSRFSIVRKKGNQILVPSLNSLSTGQIALFKMFATIVKYADSYDVNRSLDLSVIKGIVVIDEIELHLHPSMQAEVLPKLIGLFPKVQFIITTHSPLFLLGMDKILGKDSYDIIDLPSASKITTEAFSEFVSAFKYYEDTSYFEKELQNVLSSLNLNENTIEPLIITEGQTDWMHLESAYRVLSQDSKKKDLFSKLENIKFYEFEGKQKNNKDSSKEKQTLTISDKGLGKEGSPLIKAEMGDSVLKTLCANLSKIRQERIVICIFDHDKDSVVKDVMNGDNYKCWGNNVYSFAIPVPESRKKTPLISIEHYYSDDEIKTVQKIGENDYRLFMRNEFDDDGFIKSGERNIILKNANNNSDIGSIKIFDRNCERVKERRNGKSVNVALSKYHFAWNILKNEPGFNNFDFSNFIKIFEMIRDIIEHHNSQKQKENPVNIFNDGPSVNQ